MQEERDTHRRLNDAHKITAALKRQRGILVDSDLNSTVVHTLRDVLTYLQRSHRASLDVVQVDELLEEREEMQAATEEVTSMLSNAGASAQQDHEETINSAIESDYDLQPLRSFPSTECMHVLQKEFEDPKHDDKSSEQPLYADIKFNASLHTKGISPVASGATLQNPNLSGMHTLCPTVSSWLLCI